MIQDEEARKTKLKSRPQSDEDGRDSKKPNMEEPWIHPDIVVKIIHPELADGRYHKRKGHIKVSG